MKGQIVYVKGHGGSEKQSKESLKSFETRGWDVTRVEGITPKTLQNPEDIKIVDGSRLFDFKREDYNKFLTKVSCAMNHVEFWKKVVDANETMAFLEHDSICVSKNTTYKFDDLLILNADYVFTSTNPHVLNKYNYRFGGLGVCDLVNDYPLKYYKNTIWKGSFMVPGTASYAITPTGASKMLEVVDKHGIDQSDFMLNSHNLKLQYITPSPVRFSKTNLGTSLKL
jgi:GR25 family glycosyltransferase involved in LPS biosynthesis